MKKIEKFVNEITSKEYLEEKDAIEAETKSKSIAQMFAWIKNAEESTKKKTDSAHDPCGWSNGQWAVQRDADFFRKLQETIVEAVKTHHPWIAEQYQMHGGLQPKHAAGYAILGRFLDDNDSEIYRWWILQLSICPNCYREYGQSFFALNCRHPHEEAKETRFIP